MKKLKSLVAALVLGISGLANASVPTFSVDSFGSIAPLADLDIYSFDINTPPSGLRSLADNWYQASFDFLPGTHPVAAQVLFGVYKKVEHLWTLIGAKAGSGSFSFYAEPGSYKAFVAGLNLSTNQLPYHFQVAAIPETETWAMLLLGMGFVVYQVRRRQRAPGSWELR